jgi:hypothetical protein
MVYNADNATVIYRSRMHAKTRRKLPFASLTPAHSCRLSPCGRLEIFSAEEFIAAITQHIPDKGFQMVRYFGWYSNRARGERAKREAETGAPDTADLDVIDVSEYHPPRIPSKKWRELINPSSPCGLRRDSRKVWEVDPLICPHCGAEMKLIALIDDQSVIEKIATPLRSVAVRIRTARLPSVGSPPPETMAGADGPGLFVPRPAAHR